MSAQRGSRLVAVNNPNSINQLREMRPLVLDEVEEPAGNNRGIANVPTAGDNQDHPPVAGIQQVRIPVLEDDQALSHAPSLSVAGSIRSQRSNQSARSSVIQRQLAIEEELHEINERRRQNRVRLEEERFRVQAERARAEEERLREQQRLLELRSVLEEEEDDVERLSILDVPLVRPDVDKWATEQAKTAGGVHNDYPPQQPERLSMRANISDALADALSVGLEAQPKVTEGAKKSKEREELQFMADSFANAMQTVIQSVRPSDDIKLFAARQTGAKDLPEFNGNPEEWPTFYGRFKRSTELCKFNPEENIIRLQKCLRGKAKESVVSMLSAACNVEEILDVLKKRFGRPEQVIRTMLEKAKNAPTPVDGDFATLVDFSIVVKNLCATAESLQLPMYLNNPQLVEEFRRKLPAHLQLEWGRHVVKTGKDADLRELCNFLDEVSSAAAYVCEVAHGQSRKRNREQCFVVTELSCLLKCKEAHSLSLCPKFKKLKVKERYECAKKFRVCFSCLEKGHPKSDCKNSQPCDRDGCGSRDHHPLLHYNKKTGGDGTKTPERSEGNTLAVVGDVPVTLKSAILKVVPVEITGPKGKIIVNAFLDDGSTLTIMEKEVADAIGLKGQRNPLLLNWLGGKTEKDNESMMVSVKIRGINESEQFELTNVRTKEKLELPVAPVASIKYLQNWSHLANIPFPQALPTRPSIVIGEDNTFLLLARKAVEGARNEPMASWTYLGWVAHGPTSKPCGISAKYASMLNLEGVDPDQALHDLVKENFKLESLGVAHCSKIPQSVENERACQLMEATSKRIGDRWETGMLWKTDNLILPESKSVAFRRLRVLEKKMDSDPNLADSYCAKIQEYVDKGFCRKLSPQEASIDNGRRWYIPHFGRTNPNKPGKFRLVFDCAAKINGVSLNDNLLQGPDLMSPLINVLLKFRQREVAFSGDIRDMFHMVRIRKQDLPALRFLWRGKDRTQPPSVYTMDVMIFGAIASPYQAQYIKNRNAEEFQEEFPDAVEAIKNRHYVDDYLDSCSTTDEAINRIKEVREIHRRGGFEIRGWLCNSPDVLSAVAPNESKAEEIFNVQDDKLERVLGLHWDPKKDIFKFKVNTHNVDPRIVTGEKVPTKRELLKLVMSLYDPLGFIAHLTARGRMLLQDVWRSDIGWDDSLKPSMEGKWRSLLEQILKLTDTTIPRCFAPDISEATDVQLHVLCDASQQAFCCTAYLRVTGKDGNISVNIIMAKSRVAPIKATSIPRLELEAALIGARMAHFIKSQLDLPINATYLWTDSRNVIWWIRSDDPSKFKIYVAHRIGEILELTVKLQWRWVPTALNVADDATRDNVPADLSPTSRWFRGPSFLKLAETEWPVEKEVTKDIKEEDLEMKKCLMIIKEDNDILDAKNHSSWLHLTRVTAWILRFVKNLKIKRGHGNRTKCFCLLPSEIREATAVWVKKCQRESFQDEIRLIQQKENLKKSTKLHRLTLVIQNETLCLKSRIVNSPDVQADGKLPPILDSKHPWTKLLVNWYHILHGHHGIEKICNELRQSFWIIGLKAAVRAAAKACEQCKMDRAQQIVPEMAALPAVRVTRPDRPFTYVGVDYFGPLNVVNGRKREKRYGVLFTCLSTRAVHLEMAFSLTTDDFLMALDRFVCRRGEPKQLWSDNGTNFKGAEKELKQALKEMDQLKIENKLCIREIEWHFIPPGAPHFGGAWERLVRSVKVAMYTILKNRTLNDQLLSTVLAEAEACVNSRPITAVSSDPDDPEAITPNCFIMGTTSIKQMPGVFRDKDMSTRKRWRQAQILANHFWSRWLKEYLPSLALRSKWNQETPDVAVGELVFVADSNQQRNMWTKGRVEAVFPGKDGRVRVVDVKTAAGVIRRPVAKLYRIQGDS